MTSSSPERRRPAAHRLALLAVGAITVAGFAPALNTTASSYTGDAEATISVSTRPCLGDAAGYASSLIPADASVRWSFSGGLPAGATVTSDDVGQAPTVGPDGLPVCDPAELTTPLGVPGSLALVAGAAGSRLTADSPAQLDGPFTLLFWLSASPSPGELASLTGPSGALVLSVVDGSLALTVPGVVDPIAALLGPVPDGAAHLVAVTFTPAQAPADDGTIALTVDRAAAAAAPTTWEPGASTLTIGARTAAPSAGGLVDEVTLLDAALDAAQLGALVDADLGWSPILPAAEPTPTPAPTATP